MLSLAAVCLAWQSDEPAKQLAELSLKTTRTIDFTVAEGTWMSLDVSPDGKTVLFDLLGHLYTMPIEGGTAHAITTGLSFDTQPRYSPDGKWIAFVTDRSGANNLWVARPDGSEARRITSELHTLFTTPEWSRDAEYVLVSQKRPDLYKSSFEMWQYDINGGSGIQITKSNANDATPPEQWQNALGASLSPDGHYLYYARKSGYFAENVKFPLWQLARRDLRTGEEDAITDAPGSAFRPRVSPDGTLLVYATRYRSATALRVRNLETGEDRWLKYPVQHDAQEIYFANLDLLPGYAFLPGGNELVLAYGGKMHRLNIQTGADQIIPFSAAIHRELGPKLDFPHRVAEGPVRARVIAGARISPKGNRLAFSALSRLYIGDSNGGSPRRVVSGDGAEYQPAWSPDGLWLAYVTWFNEEGAIWKVRVDGTGSPQRLTSVSAYYTNLEWSPDGSRIVALRASEHQATSQADQWGHGMNVQDLVWLPAAGGVVTTIASGKGWSGPHFASEPDRIYVTVTNAHGPLAADYELLSLRWDGTDRRRHFVLKGKELWGADFSPVVQLWMHPQGRRALVLYRGQLFLIDVPHTGGDSPVLNIDAPSAEVARLTDIGADEARWAPDGGTVTWSVGPSFFSLTLDGLDMRIAQTRMAQAHAATGAAVKVDQPNTAAWAKGLYPTESRVYIEVPRYRPSGAVVLRGARVITMMGQQVLPSADIVVVDNRISALGPRGSLPIPPKATMIDVAGDTIVPGFIDTHAHWFQIRRGVLDLENWDFLASLAYGITTGRDPQTGTNDIFPYADLADAGSIIGPRAYTTGPGIFYVNDFQSVDEAADVLARYKNYYGTDMVKSYLVGNRRQREFVVEAANRLQIMPTTEGAADLALDLTHAIDGFSGNEHQLPVFPLYKDVTYFFAKSGIFYTPTYIIDGYDGPGAENYFFQTSDVFNDPKVRRFMPDSIIETKGTRMMWYRADEYVYPQSAPSAAQMIREGGKVCVGGHGEFQGLSFHWELWSLGVGLSNWQALRAATLTGAEALGLDADLGSLEAGKLADLVVLRKNPLDDLRNTTAIRYVMKNGELFDGDTLNELWPEKKPLPAMWWQTDHP
jgi:Tol biopolymer transport system component